MTRIIRDIIASLLVALALAAAISLMWFAMMTKARADGLLLPPPVVELPPPGAGVLPYTLPYRQGPPTRGCLMTAIQLGLSDWQQVRRQRRGCCLPCLCASRVSAPLSTTAADRATRTTDVKYG